MGTVSMKRLLLFLQYALSGLLSTCLFCACTNGTAAELLRTYDDPFDDTPIAVSYAREYTVFLSWQEDEAADEYVLLRADDDGRYAFRELYRGTGVSFNDVLPCTQEQTRLLYRLDKTRGNRTFFGSKYACAVSSGTLQDLYECNDVSDRATELVTTCLATMPCSQFAYNGKAFYDEDWYYVSLKPLRSAYFTLTQTDSSPSGTNTDFVFMQEGGLRSVVANGVKFKVENTSLVTKNIRFKIMPDLTRVFSGAAGARVLAYRLEVGEETP